TEKVANLGFRMIEITTAIEGGVTNQQDSLSVFFTCQLDFSLIVLHKSARASAYSRPPNIAATATSATSRFSQTINKNETAEITIAGQPTKASGISSNDTTAITPTTAALTPARKAWMVLLSRTFST